MKSESVWFSSVIYLFICGLRKEAAAIFTFFYRPLNFFCCSLKNVKMSFGAPRRTIGQLFRQGWAEIPEVMSSSFMAIIGIGLASVGAYKYAKYDGDNRRYKMTYVVMRPDDPRVAKIRKE